jgi:hypothetical protein
MLHDFLLRHTNVSESTRDHNHHWLPDATGLRRSNRNSIPGRGKVFIPGVPKKMYTACAAIHVDTWVSVAQAAVRRNQKCLVTDGNHFQHLL